MNPTVEIRTIDAWRDPEGWTWNQSFHVKDAELPDKILYSNTRLLRYLRTFLLSEGSKGRLSVCRDADSIIEIQIRGTREPIAAVMLN